jgi:cell division protein FtsW
MSAELLLDDDVIDTAPAPAEATPRQNNPLRHNDKPLFIAVFLLVGIGLVMMTSASVTIADRKYGDALFFLWRQLVALGLGVGLGVVVMRTPLEVLSRLSTLFLFVSMLLLVLVITPGVAHEVNGSMRWLKIGPLTLQASEIAKLCVVLYLAAYLVRHGDQVRNQFIGFIKPILVLMIIAVLLLLEPDYGAAAVLFATCLGMLFMAGVSLPRFLIWGVVAIAALGTVAALKAYRLARLMTFTDPWSDPFDTGFQLTQALIAFGRGEWFGVGLGASIQKMFYLPEVHTDFVLAVIAEELGFAGTVSVILLFLFVVWRCFHIGGEALRSGRAFQSYLANGVGLLLGLQAFINIGVNMGVLPTKGLPLPFISYGSNNIMMSCVAVALVLRAAHESRQPPRVWSKRVPHAQ